jgi:hypothetical protein
MIRWTVALWVLSALVAVFVTGRAVRHRSLYPFLPLRYNFGKRRNTFRDVLTMLSQRGARVLVETGTAREGLAGSKSQGASTIVFGLWAKRHGAVLHSVDISSGSIVAAESEVQRRGLSGVVRFHRQDSVEFLERFGEPVDLLYLDSYDYSKDDESVQRASQQHHLRELLAIETRLHERSMVLIDDCAMPNGGKGRLVIDHLVGRGWRVLRDEYQVLLVR